MFDGTGAVLRWCCGSRLVLPVRLVLPMLPVIPVLLSVLRVQFCVVTTEQGWDRQDSRKSARPSLAASMKASISDTV